ncbi:co-chaperone YbbN [Candidatus Chloroploca sp. Khr17]|uniref:thioredoxin family protein n=1 Tax=Candidatus Chloroploca sp. Khr17 TaxID=2496869 RepID=UPI00101C05B9|nr:thioredoxin family protein [Candidatus Chloroploca sp. Khr17]
MRMLTTHNFDQLTLNGEEITVVLFGDDSIDCRKAERQMDAIAGIFAGAVRFFYVDTYESDALAARYGVISSPAVVLLQRGLAHWRFEGALSREAIQDLKRRLFTVGVASAPEPGPIAPPKRAAPRCNLRATQPNGYRATDRQSAQPNGYRATDRQSAQPYRSRPEFSFEETVIVPVLTLFENKAHIISERDLALAMAQTIRYHAKARQLRSFVVTATEGLWVFRRSGNQATLEQRFTRDELTHGALEAKQLLIELSCRRRKPLV